MLAVSCASAENSVKETDSRAVMNVSLHISSSRLGMSADTENGKLTVEVSGNPTTGYQWVADDSSSLKCVSSDYVASSEALVGGGGYYVFVFEAVKAGLTDIDFEYVRSWEGEEASEFSLLVTIDDNLTITKLEVI